MPTFSAFNASHSLTCPRGFNGASFGATRRLPVALQQTAARENDREEDVAASSDEKASASQKAADLKLPARGLFALADPDAEVYSKAKEQFDPTKKPGRYQSDFIWNTNWQEQLKIEEDLRQSVSDDAFCLPGNKAA